MDKDKGTLVSLNLEASKPFDDGPTEDASATISGSALATASGNILPGISASSLISRPVSSNGTIPIHGPSHRLLEYNQAAFPFAALTMETLGVHDFSDLNEIASSMPGVPRSEEEEEDWRTRRFYRSITEDAHHPFVRMYHRFVAHIVQRLFPDEDQMLFQTTPSLRIQRWNSTAVPYHFDSDDVGKHVAGEVNFLLPLTNNMQGKCFNELENSSSSF